jgi:hypothetical protein
MAVRVLGFVVTVDDDPDAALAARRGPNDHAIGDGVERGIDRHRDVGRRIVVMRLREPLGVLLITAPSDGGVRASAEPTMACA